MKENRTPMMERLRARLVQMADVAAEKRPMTDVARGYERACDELLEWLAAQPAPVSYEWVSLAADIRAVDGNHDLGAGALASALTERGWTRLNQSDPANTRVHDSNVHVPRLKIATNELMYELWQEAKAFVDWYDSPPYVYVEDDLAAHIHRLRDIVDALERPQER
jgi:hypothetical protein